MIDLRLTKTFPIVIIELNLKNDFNNEFLVKKILLM